MQFSVYQESHIGGRKVNQDRMGYSYTRDALLLMLADGMGGHLRGEVAASIALSTMSAMFQQQATPFIKGPERFLREAFVAAHEEIHRYRELKGLPDTPRTTVVACLIQHNTAIWAHCGDSRLYWVRNGALMSRTRDHSHIEHLIAKGTVPESVRTTHPDRNKLYNCIGASSLPRVEVSGIVNLQGGDVLMLCSDGLWSMVPDERIAGMLASTPLGEALPEMISIATTKAGAKSDNTTALAISWQGALGDDAIDTASAAMISTQTLPENVVTTTIQAAPDKEPEIEFDAFDEEEIEKAIAEIRVAIEKSSQILKG